jgi:hypothetical protein
MRILTSSKENPIGLISIQEANDNAAQNVIFCIPIEKFQANQIKTLGDFSINFRDGITTKIIIDNKIEIIRLRFVNKNFNTNWSQPETFPKFTATILSVNVEFFLSRANFDLEKGFLELDINRRYTGDIHEDLMNKNLILLEPNWKQLDKLFLQHKVLFVDWK